MSDGRILDLQMESKLAKDNGAVGFGTVEFLAQPNAADILTLGARTYGFTSGGDVQITIGGSVALTLDNCVTAINGDASNEIEVIKGSGDNTLILIDKAGAAAAGLAIAESTAGARLAVSAAALDGAAIPAVKVYYDFLYAITAQDAAALARDANTGQIAIGAIPATVAPSNFQVQVRDAAGVLQATANVALAWVQINSRQFALMLTDGAADLANTDVISIIAIM